MLLLRSRISGLFLQLNIIRAKWRRLQAQKNKTQSFTTAFHSFWIWPLVCTRVNNDLPPNMTYLGNWFSRWSKYSTNEKVLVLQCSSTHRPTTSGLDFLKNTNVCSITDECLRENTNCRVTLSLMFLCCEKSKPSSCTASPQNYENIFGLQHSKMFVITV